MSKNEIIRSATLYNPERKFMRDWRLQKEIHTGKEFYEDRAKEILIGVALDHFNTDITKIEFPKLLRGEFFYCFITNKEGERYEISLGV